MSPRTAYAGFRRRGFTHLVRLMLTVCGVFLLHATAVPSEKILSSPASTPEPGLIIQGDVHLNDFSGPGLADTSIYRSYASYNGTLVAITDSMGHYQTDFAYIPGDEMVTVWAEKEGYSLDPPQYYWRHYYSHEVQTLNFLARPLVANCLPPLPTPNRLLVNRNSWQTGELTYPLYIYLGRDGSATSAKAVITVTSVSGTVTQTGFLSIFTGMPITMTLLPNTVHQPTVYGQFEHTPECSYVTSTRYDLSGYPLIITQGSPFRAYLALILR